MLADYFLDEFPGSHIVYDARNSHSVPDLILAKSGKPIISRVGHSLIKQEMRKHNAPFGGEASGHFYFRDNWFADSGLIAAVIGLYVATLSGQSLSKLRKKYTKYFAIPETNFVVKDKDAVIARIKQIYKDYHQSDLDGVSVFFDNGDWVNVRPSNTESILRLNVEARNKGALDRLTTKLTQLITE